MDHIEQLSQVYLVRNYEMTIDASPKTIWPLLLEFERFNQTFERIEVLSGKRDELGSICLCVKQQGEWYLPPYLVKVVHIVPERQIVWKNFPVEGSRFCSYVDFSLTPDGPRTRFRFSIYAETLVPRTSAQGLETLEKKMNDDYIKLEGHLFPTLKKLAEDR